MLSFFTQACKRLYEGFAAPLRAIFNRTQLDEQTLEELRTLFLEADMGVATTEKLLAALQKEVRDHPKDKLPDVVRRVLISVLQPAYAPRASTFVKTTGDGTAGQDPERIIMMVGVNGSGKTTTIAKLTAQARAQGKRVLLVAADTFRAAAPEQLTAWAQQLGADIITGGAQQDPASVIFNGCHAFRTRGIYDLMIIDTSGRVQIKTHLMDELAKLRRVLSKQLPQEPVATLITLDSMLGQNSLQQVELFHACTPLSGIVLTKLDGTGKGGILFAIADTVKIPIRYVTTGESPDALAPFDAATFVDALLRQES